MWQEPQALSLKASTFRKILQMLNSYIAPLQ